MIPNIHKSKAMNSLEGDWRRKLRDAVKRKELFYFIEAYKGFLNIAQYDCKEQWERDIHERSRISDIMGSCSTVSIITGGSLVFLEFEYEKRSMAHGSAAYDHFSSVYTSLHYILIAFVLT